jgi:uncharacterized protein (TIGR02246 family)
MTPNPSLQRTTQSAYSFFKASAWIAPTRPLMMAKMTMRSVLIVLSAFGCLAACSLAPTSAEPETVSSVVPALADAFSGCNLDKVASLYSADAEFIAPDTPKPIIGRDAVMKHLAGACTSTYKPIMKVIEQRIYRLGSDGAVVSGTYTFGRTDRANDAPWTASFVITLVRTGGAWLIQSQATFARPT